VALDDTAITVSQLHDLTPCCASRAAWRGHERHEQPAERQPPAAHGDWEHVALDARQQNAAPLQPGEVACAADRLTPDDDLRHRPATGALGQQPAKLRDVVQPALLERDLEALQEPASTRAVHAATDRVHDNPAHRCVHPWSDPAGAPKIQIHPTARAKSIGWTLLRSERLRA